MKKRQLFVLVFRLDIEKDLKPIGVRYRKIIEERGGPVVNAIRRGPLRGFAMIFSLIFLG
jgi:hypothetical protein